MQNATTARNTSAPALAVSRRSEALAMATPVLSVLGASAGLVVLAVLGG